MSASHTAAQLGFNESINELVTRLECRRLEGDDEREAVFRLRYSAYLQEGAIAPSFPPRFTDRHDEGPNATTFGLYLAGSLVSSIRVHVATRETPDFPGFSVFPDYLGPRIAAGQTIVDPTRFVVDLASARLEPKLPYATVRLAWLAAEHFGADLILASVRVEHQAFYRRLCGHRVVCEARPYPTLAKPISLMELDFPQERERVQRRYSFFESTRAERKALFGPARVVAGRSRQEDTASEWPRSGESGTARARRESAASGRVAL